MTKPIPDGFNSVTPGIVVDGDDDALHARAVAAGATEINPVADQFHGDRAGSVRCPFGHRWAIATHTEDMSGEEMQRRMEEWMAQAGGLIYPWTPMREDGPAVLGPPA